MILRYARSRFVLVFVLLIVWRLLLIHLDAPWFGHHDANGVWLSAASRNARLYDSLAYPLVPVINLGPIPPETPRWYVHHPPLVVWAMTLANEWFGEHEMALRYVSILSTMVAVAGFYVFCRRLYASQRALLCTLLLAFTPMMIFFGRMPNHEPLSLAFLLPFAAGFVNWARRPTRRRWGAVVALALLAIWTAWAAFFFVFCLSLFCLPGVAPSSRRRLIALAVIAVGGLASVMLFFQLVYPDALTDLLNAFVWRTSTVSEISTSFTLGEFFAQQAVHLLPHATIAVFLLGVVGLIPILKYERGLNRVVILAMGAAGLIYIIVFRSASYVHDYYKIYLMPFLAISAASAITHSLRHRKYRRFANPALVGLFAVSAVFAVIYLQGKYNAPFATGTLALSDYIAGQSSPQDVVYTNLEAANPTIEYYAFRHIEWGYTQAEAGELASADAYPAVYIRCDLDSAGSTSSGQPEGSDWSFAGLCEAARLK